MIKIAFLNLSRNKSRTFLAVLGIAIGIASIISLIGFVNGMENKFTQFVGGIQGISIKEKGVIDETLSRLDSSLKTDLEKIQGVNKAIKEIWVVLTTIDKKNPSANNPLNALAIYGVDTKEYYSMHGNGWIPKPYKGNNLSPNDSKKIIIGKKIAEDYKKFIGSNIKINGENFKVKGIFKADDTTEQIIMMNLKDARELSNLPNNKVSTFHLDLLNPEEDQKIAQKINFRFENIKAMTSSDYSETLSKVLGNFKLLILVIAGIAAIVAGIGIVNVMLMSVFERFKEIGTLKAVGWTNYNVIKMILMESILIGLIGSTAGLILSVVAGNLIKSYIGLNFVITNELLINAFLYGLIISLIASAWPTWKVVKLQIIDILNE